MRYRNIARIAPRELPTDTSLARANALGFDAVALTGGHPDDVGRAAVGGLGVLLDLPAGELEPWLEAGVVGFCCAAAHERPPASWKRLIARARGRYPETLFLAFTYGAAPAAVAALAQCGFDAAASSSCWWDFRAAWIDEDAARVEALGEVIALTEPPSGPRRATERARRRALVLAAHYAPLWMMTLGFEAGFEAEVAAVKADGIKPVIYSFPDGWQGGDGFTSVPLWASQDNSGVTLKNWKLWPALSTGSSTPMRSRQSIGFCSRRSPSQSVPNSWRRRRERPSPPRICGAGNRIEISQNGSGGLTTS